MSRRKIKKPRAREFTQVLGIAWYRADQWERLRDISADRDELEPTHEEWRHAAEQATQSLTDAGAGPRRVDVDVEALLKWCKKEGVPVN